MMEEPMSADKNLFADFDFDNLQVGEQPAPLKVGPAEVAAASTDIVQRPKRGRKPKASAPAETVPKTVRKTRGPRRVPAAVDTAIESRQPEPAVTKTRKPRTAKADHKPIKLDLATAMQVANTLKDGDGALFQKMVQALSGLNKASRDRILAALGKVFA